MFFQKKKGRSTEMKKRRLEIKEAKENLWRKKQKPNKEEGSDARSMKDRRKTEGDLEENIEKLDKIIARLKREEKRKKKRKKEQKLDFERFQC